MVSKKSVSSFFFKLSKSTRKDFLLPAGYIIEQREDAINSLVIKNDMYNSLSFKF